MNPTFHGTHVSRESLPETLTQLNRQHFTHASWEEFVMRPPPPRGGAVGSWSNTHSDPLAEVLVVRDEDFLETLTWLNSFFAGLSPITQWCRIIPFSAAERMEGDSSDLSLGENLGPWLGAIIAECSVQAGGAQNLREMPGSAALSTATFAAGRSTVVWPRTTDYKEIAQRHDYLFSAISRDVSRPLSAEKLVPLWRVLGGNAPRVAPKERDAMQPLVAVLSHISALAAEADPAEVVYQVAMQSRDYFDLPELTDCAEGPQISRVKALDRLGERLLKGPTSPVIDALLGMGASFIDPGSAVAPELLRRYSKVFPVAPIWQGAFAGAILPFRVLNDQGGLGRLISKSLLAAHDLKGRPSCDIAFEEVARWVTPGRPLRLDVRGNFARILNVELVSGVTCSFSTSRSAATAAVTSQKIDARVESDPSRSARVGIAELEVAVRALQQRVAKLEDQRATTQQSLDFPEQKEGRSRKSSRPYLPKKS